MLHGQVDHQEGEAQGGERQPRAQQLLVLETGQVGITSVLELKE